LLMREYVTIGHLQMIVQPLATLRDGSKQDPGRLEALSRAPA
jgi:hypothetical protein